MRDDTRMRKKVTSGLKHISEENGLRNQMLDILFFGKNALDEVMLQMGKQMVEAVMLMEREEMTGRDYFPTDPDLKKWASQRGSVYLGDQKIRVFHPRVRDVLNGREVSLKSYEQLKNKGVFSNELLEKMLHGVSAQKYEETVISSAAAVGVSASTVSRHIVEATSQKLKEFRGRSLSDVK